jgi:hypothetical protein
MLPTRLSRVVAATLAIAAIACGDPTKPKAVYVNAPGSYAIYAFTGAPATGSTAISFLGGAVRTDASFTFDVALDLDQTGKTIVYPVRKLGSALVGGLKRVGLQPVPGTFEALRVAPTTGYDTVNAQVIAPGTVLAVELQDINNCAYSLGGQLLYAKLVVDSVQSASRRIFVRTVVDPNCGYLQLMPDTIPET